MRLAVRDFGTALSFDGVNDKVFNSNVPTGWDTAGAAVVWYKVPKAVGALSRLKLLNVGGGGVNRIGMVVNIPSGRVDVGYYDGSTYTSKSGTPSNNPTGEWHSAIYSWNGTSMELYLDGIAQSGSNSPVSGVQTGVVFGEQGGANFGGLADEIALWTRTLNAEEAAAIARAGPYPTNSMWLYWKCDESSGTVALDSSGNGNDGTITGAAYTSDVPMKARTAVPTSGDPRLMRRAVGGNMVLNGDFEYAPPFTAATTNNNRVIDGTASGGDASVGSAVMQAYKWKVNMYNTTAPSAQYDTSTVYKGTASMKLSGTQIKERVNITLGSRVHGDLNDPADIQTNLIPVLPNKSYTFSITTKLQAANVVGTPAGIYVNILEHTASGVKASNYPFNGPGNGTGAVTYDWTPATYVFTTTADTRYINIYCALKGDSSNYFDGTAWFDSIDLRPTLPVTRALAGNRTLA